MNKTRILKRSLLAVAVIASTSQAHAAGFQLNAQSATGIGRAFAGDAVIADNASSMARNPATMALFDKTSLSLGFETIITDISVKNGSGATVIGGSTVATNDYQDYDDVGGTAVAPNIHLIVPINEKFAVGVNAYSNFGTSTDFSGSQDYSNSLYGGETDIKSVNIGLAASYRLNEQWSFGAGLDAIYGQGTFRRGGSELGLGTVQTVDVEDADGWAVGFNVGTVYELDENNRWGLSYRYTPDISVEDDKNQKIDLPLPDMAEFSGYHHIKDTDFAVHYSVQWIGWSAFDEIDFENLNAGYIKGDYNKQYQWQDGFHFAIGGTWYVSEKVELRTGYMHDTSAQDTLTSISVPDSDRNWLSAGASYHFTADSTLDFGITYLVGADESVNESAPIIDPTSGQLIGSHNVTATTRADAILVGLQYSQSF